MGSKAIIRVKDLRAGYGKDIILDHVSFNVYEGEVFVILGGSGCGKSTLLKAIIGLIEPRSGKITIDGDEVSVDDDTTLQKILRKVGVLYQGAALFGSMTIAE
ncbi:MAG: ATP-binding cassette domain-containing protein, partial [Desulfobacteraceae bacterium]|nr:ATP-binding cassette domain-containing protein [Desulfobacteraceae bacterium]